MSEESTVVKPPDSSWCNWITGIAAGIAGILFVVFLRKPEASLIQWHWLLFLVCPAVVFAALVIWQKRRSPPGLEQGPPDYFHIVAWALTLSALLYLFSGATADPWFYFLRWLPGSVPESSRPLLTSGLTRLCLGMAVIAPVLIFCRSRVCMWVITLGVLILCQSACFNQLWRITGGEALYNGDHPGSMYRLWAYAHSFPGIASYDPFWNGGREAACLSTTGIVPLGTAFFPFWRFFPVDQVYTPVLAFVFMLIIPLMAGFSVRIVNGGWIAACCAGIMALGVSQDFFRWLLQNGAIGSCLALSFIMPVSACIYRVIWLDGLENRTGIILTLAAAVFLAWPPAAVMAAVFLPAVLLSARKCSFRKIILLVLCSIVVAVLCIPAVISILGHADLTAVLSPARERPVLPAILREGWVQLCGLIRSGNPCIIFFGLLGLWFLPARGMKRFFGTVVIALCILAGWGDSWNPELQVSRAGIPLFFAAIIPAALCMEKCLEDSSVRMVMVRSAILVLLLLGGLNTAAIYAGRGPATFTTMSPEMRRLVEWIGKNTRAGDRILLAGDNTSGECGIGNPACLPMITGREIMDAESFQLSPPDIASLENENSLDDTSSFMNLYRVSYVLTCSRQWRDYFVGQPQQYEEVKSFSGAEKRTMFKVIRKATQFVKGSGSVKAGIDELVIQLDNPLEEAVLRYNWIEGMYAEEPAEAYPFVTGKDIRFIALKPHGKTTVTISYGKLF